MPGDAASNAAGATLSPPVDPAALEDGSSNSLLDTPVPDTPVTPLAPLAFPGIGELPDHGRDKSRSMMDLSRQSSKDSQSELETVPEEDKPQTGLQLAIV